VIWSRFNKHLFKISALPDTTASPKDIPVYKPNISSEIVTPKTLTSLLMFLRGVVERAAEEDEEAAVRGVGKGADSLPGTVEAVIFGGNAPGFVA
jgi:hypothetical protein